MDNKNIGVLKYAYTKSSLLFKIDIINIIIIYAISICYTYLYDIGLLVFVSLLLTIIRLVISHDINSICNFYINDGYEK